MKLAGLRPNVGGARRAVRYADGWMPIGSADQAGLAHRSPLVCPRGGQAMRILAFIRPAQSQVIERILRHSGLWEPLSRGPPAHDAASREPDPRELRSVGSPVVPAKEVWNWRA